MRSRGRLLTSLEVTHRTASDTARQGTPWSEGRPGGRALDHAWQDGGGGLHHLVSEIPEGAPEILEVFRRYTRTKRCTEDRLDSLWGKVGVLGGQDLSKVAIRVMRLVHLDVLLLPSGPFAQRG